MKIYWQIKKKCQVLLKITAKTCKTLRHLPLVLPTSSPIPRVLGCGLTSYLQELNIPICRTFCISIDFFQMNKKFLSNECTHLYILSCWVHAYFLFMNMHIYNSQQYILLNFNCMRCLLHDNSDIHKDTLMHCLVSLALRTVQPVLKE